MPSCARVLAETLRDAGVERAFGLPGGEILEFVEAARQVGIRFLLTRDEITAALMADVSGQIRRRPGVCVSTLGPGAVNMTLGVANAFLDRSPLLAITASSAKANEPYATHQRLDLAAVYRPFTKATIALDGRNTAAKVRAAYQLSLQPRMGPVHIALPSDTARLPDVETDGYGALVGDAHPPAVPAVADLARMADILRAAQRPIVVLGLDLDPRCDAGPVRSFVEKIGAPVFVTPKAKGMLPEDHPLFFGVCAGVSGDWAIVDLFEKADLLVGIGFEPVESDRLWHHTQKLVSIGPVSIADAAYAPHFEVVGDVRVSLRALEAARLGPYTWPRAALAAYHHAMQFALRPAAKSGVGLSPSEVTRCLREAVPRDTVLATDVGAIKSVTSQVWRAYEPLTFFESNGLSTMRYGLAGAMAARLEFPERPVVCTIGDGGMGMTLSELETCVRERIHFLTVVYNDSALSLIRVAQAIKGHPDYGVRYGSIDFARAADALGASGRRVTSLDELAQAAREGLKMDRPALIEVPIDPSEYLAHSARPADYRPLAGESGAGDAAAAPSPMS
jgi:acetolactate synthase-1/2/3 large subunit